MDKVKPYKTFLDKANAYWMAKIAKAVYSKISDKDIFPDENQILESLKGEDPMFCTVSGFSENSAQGAIIEHEEYICMAFRGTDELADWLDNLNAFSTQQIFGEFHRGFWQSTDDLWADMFKHYKELLAKKKRPLFITGHSLGGALSTVAAAKLVHQDLPFTSVYTFGQPRVMSRATCRLFDVASKKRFFRFQNNNDLVTRVPARVMGYSHVGTYLYISEERKLHDDPGFWFRFLDYVDGALEDAMKLGLDGIKDHGIDNYIEAIRAWDCDFSALQP